jgi:hypothetical protein
MEETMTLNAQVEYILGATDIKPIESTDTNRPTPWGKADFQYKVERGVALVNTPGHGGFMISKGKAQTYLSPEALQYGSPYGGYLTYEEDIDAAIVLLEHQELIPALGFKCTEADLIANLKTYRDDYLQARSIRLAKES